MSDPLEVRIPIQLYVNNRLRRYSVSVNDLANFIAEAGQAIAMALKHGQATSCSLFVEPRSK